MSVPDRARSLGGGVSWQDPTLCMSLGPCCQLVNCLLCTICSSMPLPHSDRYLQDKGHTPQTSLFLLATRLCTAGPQHPNLCCFHKSLVPGQLRALFRMASPTCWPRLLRCTLLLPHLGEKIHCSSSWRSSTTKSWARERSGMLLTIRLWHRS